MNNRELKGWNTKAYVVQRVGDAGQWYDYSIWNTNPLEIKSPDFEKHIKDAMPNDQPWRLILRVAREDVVDYNYPD